MTPYYEDDGITIYHADARDVLPTFAAESVDFVFTDPPYGHNNNDGDLAHRWEVALGTAAAAAVVFPYWQVRDAVRIAVRDKLNGALAESRATAHASAIDLLERMLAVTE